MCNPIFHSFVVHILTDNLIDRRFFSFNFHSMFMDAFKKRIESAVERNGSKGLPDPNAVIHEMALYPTCKWRIFFRNFILCSYTNFLSSTSPFAGSKNNETAWLEENTAKLYFSSNLFDKLMPNTFLHRAVLR